MRWRGAAAPLRFGRRSMADGIRTRWRKQAHGGAESSVDRASEHAILGEEGEETTAELPVGLNLTGEERSGG